MDRIVRPSEIEVQHNHRGILSRKLISLPQISIMELSLTPKQFIPPHTVPVEVVFLVQSGTGELRIGTEYVSVQKGDLVHCPRDMAMEVQAGTEGLKLLNIKTPHPSHAEENNISSLL